MRYSLFAGGKRIRPAMAMASFNVCGGQGEDIFFATSALEMLHTFSLIHDDLPCMDDDDFRRGKPTNHKKFDEATAVLAGDALCILAFQLLAKTNNAQCIQVMARALGTEGMIGGQMEDIQAEGQKADLKRVQFIHTHKTAALIEASLVIGALLADADDETIAILSAYGQKIGLAFQVVDDILDLEQTTEELGKDAGSDELKNKATYPAVLGMQKSKDCAQELKAQAIQKLEPLSGDTTILKELADFIVNRVN
ncbi:MAG: polyprenyl synthetase family protein [Fibrobacteria bacterium]|nr:polyprenyl synthetase family protein [Fibrobacteria bacterium]